jgi:hypothetical protein
MGFVISSSRGDSYVADQIAHIGAASSIPHVTNTSHWPWSQTHLGVTLPLHVPGAPLEQVTSTLQVLTASSVD